MTSTGRVTSPPGEVTQLLKQLRFGNREAEEKLVSLVYNQLRRLAAARMRRERPDHTLQPTALVHEAYLKLTEQRKVSWVNRAHFYSVAARVMRRILIDHAREVKASKRGGGHKVPIEDSLAYSEEKSGELLAIDQALTRLAERDPRQSHVVELRFFGGCSEEEIAGILGISARTVKRDWRMARAWLFAELSKK
jgi:RNA polymerase sigma-70 factor (ECF subfamily)